jgi:hypothetical protein
MASFKEFYDHKIYRFVTMVNNFKVLHINHYSCLLFKNMTFQRLKPVSEMSWFLNKRQHDGYCPELTAKFYDHVL